MNGSMDPDCRPKPLDMHPDLDHLYWAVFQVVFPVLVVLGVITNVMNIIVLTRPRMGHEIYRWLRTLAVVDIFLCILTIPVCLANSGHTPSGFALAKYYSIFGWSLSIGSQIVSFYLMVWFAYDRYLAVCLPDQYPSSLHFKVYLKRVVVTVLSIILVYTPLMAVGKVCPVEDTAGRRWQPLDGYRWIDSDWYKAYSWFREIFSRVVPAALITFFNIKIVLRLKELRRVRSGFASGDNPSRREKEQKLVVLLFWVTVSFYVYNTPVAIYYLGFLNHETYNHGEEDQILTFGVISNLIQMIGNVSNFTLYFLINPEFRKTLRDLCCFCSPSVVDLEELENGESSNVAQPSRNSTVDSNLSTNDSSPHADVHHKGGAPEGNGKGQGS